jgi:hypothetical protein
MRTRDIAIGVSLVVAVVWLGWNTARDHRLKTTFEKVVVGDSKLRLNEVMGLPNEVVKGCGYFGTTPVATCAEEHLYFPFWTRLLDEVWSVSFSSDGHVVHKHHLLSP